MFRTSSPYILSIGFFVAGILHFTSVDDLAAITPLPYAREIVWVTGVMELFFAVFLLLPRYRPLTGVFLSLFCLAVLPANINMAINDIPMFGEHVHPVIAWLRIPAQFGLIAWILWATRIPGTKLLSPLFSKNDCVND